MSFSSLWQLVKHSMKPVTKRGTRSSQRPHLLRNQRKSGIRLLLEVLEDRTLLSVNWINPAGGDWGTPSNWSTNALPGPNDDVVINVAGATVTHSTGTDSVNSLTSTDPIVISGGSLSLAGNSSITAALALTGGATLAGTGNLTITGQFTWSGDLATTGTTTAAGGIAISGGSFLETGTLVNLGSATDAGGLYMDNGAHFDNQGTCEFVADGQIRVYSGAAPLFSNEGQVIADAGTNLTGISVNFVSTGTVAVHGGTFVLGYATSSTTTDLTADAGTTLTLLGDFQVASNIQADNVNFVSAGGTVTVGGSVIATGQVYVFYPYSTIGTSVSVAGSYQAGSTALNHGHLTLTGPVTALGAVSVFAGELTLSPSSPQTLTVPSLSLTANGTLDGIDNLTITGQFTWAGDLATTGTTTAAGGIAISSAYLENGTLVNLGTATESANMNDGADIDNRGTWKFASDGVISIGTGAGPLFTNEGLVVADAGTSSTGIKVNFVNTGTVAVHGGTFVLGYATSSTTTDLTADAGTTLTLLGDFQVAGNIQADNVNFVSAGGTVTVGGSVIATGQVYVFYPYSTIGTSVSVAGSYQAGSTALNHGHLTLTGPVTALGAVSVFAGELTLSPSSPQTLTVPSLSLTANGTLDGIDNLTITGQFTWAGDLATTGTTTAAGGIAISGGSFLETGTLVNLGSATDAGGLYMDNGAHFDNQGTCEFVADGQIRVYSGAAPLFSNEGQVIADAGTNLTGISVNFVNTGTVAVHGGIFSLDDGSNSGTIVGDAGTVLNFVGGNFTLIPGTAIAADKIALGENMLDLQLGGPNPGTGYDQVTVGTSGTLSGNLQLDVVNGFRPFLYEQFTIIHNLGANPLSGSFSNLPEGSSVIIAGSQFQITYQGGANHNDVVFTAIKITPTISWSNPADITYGKALSKTQLDASAAIVTQLNSNASFTAGTFVYTPAAGTVLNAGSGQTLGVVFTPTDTVDYFPATGTVTINVNKADQDLDWTAPAAIVFGTALSAGQLDASVAGVAGGSAPGTLTYNPPAGTLLGVGNGQVLTVTVAATPNYNQAIKTVHLSVMKTGTTTGVVTSTFDPSTYAQTITLSAVVAANNPGAGVPTGTVKFFDNGKNIGTGTLGNTGLASLNIARLTAGQHSITAGYQGDGNDLASVSVSSLDQSVAQQATTTSLSSSTDPADVTKAVSFTATVNFNAGGATPTGTVTFMDGATPLGTSNLAGGSATLKTTALTVGSHTITAVYNGNSDYLGSTSANLNQVINPLADLAVTVSGASTVLDGKNITYTIKVTNKGPSADTGVTLTDILPASEVVVSSTFSYQLVGDIATFTIGTLASGQSVIIKLVVNTTMTGIVVDTVSVTGTDADPNTANNADSVSTTVK